MIDDDADTALTMADILQADGHRVHVALSGPAGVDMVRQVRPDVVFCDIGLPGMDGFEVARTLRNLVGFAGKLVAFTGHVYPQDRERCAAAGFDGHLPKPADVEQIIELVR